MRKSLNVLLCLGLLFQNLIITMQVTASESNYQAKFYNINLKQGDKELELNNDKYVIKDYDEIVLTYELTNYDKTKGYYIKETEYDAEGAATWSYPYGGKIPHKLSPNKNYKYEICNNNDCDIKYDTLDIIFDNQLYEYKNNSYIYIESVYQGGKEISTDNINIWSNYTSYNFNSLEKITYKIKGVNLQEDTFYKLDGETYLPNNISENILGSDLNDGYEFSYYPTLTKPHSFTLTRGDYRVSYLLYNNNDELIKSYGDYSDEDNVNLSDFELDLNYTNYMDIKINKSLPQLKYIYLVTSKYHNKDNSLSLKIDGNNNFENTEYDIKIEGYTYDEKTYEKTYKINGNEISQGTIIELENYLLEYINEYEKYDINNKLYVTIGDVKKEMQIYYTQLDSSANISSHIYFENGKKNLSTFRGTGGVNWLGGIADTNKTAFTKYSSIYLNFTGEGFDNHDNYEYILEYGYFDEKISDGIPNYNSTKVLDKGTINGKTLNTIGMNFRVNNSNNYQKPFYRFAIKKGEEIIYYQAPVLSLVNSPTLANVSMKANNKNLYLQTDDMNYISTRNHPIDIVVSGLGFKEDKEYEFDFCYSYDSNWQEQVCKKIAIKGKDLNNGNGTAKFKFNEQIPKEVSKIDFTVYTETTSEQYEEQVAIQGGFGVTLVDSKDYFSSLSKYTLDNTGDFIKNISKLTNVKDFTNNVNVTNNGKVKIFDKTGTNEIKDTIGTGMIARVINEYNENMLDLDIIVKGDVTGDGNISITDLVKVKRHLSQTAKLAGVYEKAGNVTDSGKIGITDLVKISRDVAKIQEVK